MSWKSIVTAGLFCVLASPAFAVPLLTVTNTGGSHSNGHLNVDGNWVWQVKIAPTGGSSVSAELGFTESSASELVGATKNGTNFDDDNPGTVIFGWEPLTDVDPLVGSTNLRPVGLLTSLANDQVFAALGGPIVPDTNAGPTNETAQEYITIISQGPAVSSIAGPNPRLTSTILFSGIFGSGDDGRITETLAGTSVKTDTFNGSATFTVKIGDANIDNSVDIGDFNIWKVGGAVVRWQDGDFNDDGSVDIGDFNLWKASPGGGGGIAGTAGVGVPEPTSVALILLGGLFATAVRRGRKS